MGALGAFLTLLLGGGCGPSTPAPGPVGAYLENATWYLVSVDGRRPDSSAEVPWLRVAPADGVVHGFAGCNSFNGPYRAGGATLTFGPLATTRMACADARRSELERTVLEVLTAADGYRVRDTTLELLQGDRVRMTLVAGPGR